MLLNRAKLGGLACGARHRHDMITDHQLVTEGPGPRQLGGGDLRRFVTESDHSELAAQWDRSAPEIQAYRERYTITDITSVAGAPDPKTKPTPRRARTRSNTNSNAADRVCRHRIGQTSLKVLRCFSNHVRVPTSSVNLAEPVMAQMCRLPNRICNHAQ